MSGLNQTSDIKHQTSEIRNWTSEIRDQTSVIDEPKSNDTAFVRFPKKDREELFIYYNNNIPISGGFVFTNDSSFVIELDSAYVGDSILRKNIISFKNVVIEPVYMFGKRRIVDFISASYLGADFFTEKKTYTVLYITSSGVITKAEFPGYRNMLSVEQEHILTRMYINMPRWQPLFVGNNTKQCVIHFSNTLEPKWRF